MWIKNEDGYYIYKLQGVVCISWVSEKDRSHAEYFPDENIEEWIAVLSKASGMKLTAVEPY